MAVVQIPNLPPAIALNGNEPLEIVQSGQSRRCSVQQIANLGVTITSAQIVENISVLQGLDIQTSTPVFVEGYYNIGDGGGGYFYGVNGAAPGTYVNNGGTIIVPPGGDGSSAWLRFVEGPYNILWFGAKNDVYITNNTPFIQAAVDAACNDPNGGSVYFPSGQYRVNGTINIYESNISLFGDGAGSTFIYPHGDFGDVFKFQSNDATYLQRNSLRDIAFYTQTDTTQGSTIRLTKCRQFHMTDVDISAHYGGLKIESCAHSYFTNVNLTSDMAFASYRSGSYLLNIGQVVGAIIPSELHFSGCDWRGANGNNYLDYAVVITSADGVWFNSCHWGFCKSAAMAILPQSATTQISAINVCNYYLDTVVSGYGLLVVPPAGYTADLGFVNFTNGQIYNCGIGIGWVGSNNTKNPSVISNTQILNVYNHGVQTSGDSISFIGVDVIGCNISNTTGFGFQLIGTQNINILGCSVRQLTGYAAPTAGISVDSGCQYTRISDMLFEGCVDDILNASTSYTAQVSASLTNKGIITVNANGSGAINVPFGFDTVFIGGLNNASSITTTASFLGRKITFIASAPVTFYNGAINLNLSGNWVADTVGDTLTVVFDGSLWHEIGRSNNT